MLNFPVLDHGPKNYVLKPKNAVVDFVPVIFLEKGYIEKGSSKSTHSVGKAGSQFFSLNFLVPFGSSQKVHVEELRDEHYLQEEIAALLRSFAMTEL